MNFEREFPKIGEEVTKFIESFGKPVTQSSTLYNFDVVGNNSPLLLCTVTDGIVTNIAWEAPVDPTQLKKLAKKFLPEEAKKLKENEPQVIEILNGDVATSIDLYHYNGEKPYVINLMVGELDFAIDLQYQD